MEFHNFEMLYYLFLLEGTCSIFFFLFLFSVHRSLFTFLDDNVGEMQICRLIRSSSFFLLLYNLIDDKVDDIHRPPFKAFYDP